MEDVQSKKSSPVKLDIGDSLYIVMSTLFLFAMVLVVVVNLYRVFFICVIPVDVVCSDVSSQGDTTEFYDVSLTGVIGDEEFTWIETQYNPSISVGDHSTIYVGDQSLSSSVGFTTVRGRMFWLVAACITMLLGCAIVYAILSDRSVKNFYEK